MGALAPVLAAAMPGTQAQLAERVHRSIKTVCVELSSMVLEAHQAHIASWARQERGGKPIATYAAGPGTNAPRPAPSRAALYCKFSRARKFS